MVKEQLLQCLRTIQLDQDVISAIEDGGEIYGDCGSLDSIELVGFIAAIEKMTGVDVSGADVMELMEAFENISNLEAFMRRNGLNP